MTKSSYTLQVLKIFWLLRGTLPNPKCYSSIINICIILSWVQKNYHIPLTQVICTGTFFFETNFVSVFHCMLKQSLLFLLKLNTCSCMMSLYWLTTISCCWRFANLALFSFLPASVDTASKASTAITRTSFLKSATTS